LNVNNKSKDILIMNSNIKYIAIDLHHSHSVIGWMNQQGTYLGQQRFVITRTGLISRVVTIPGEPKHLTIGHC
jgi:hypothetical protein